MVGMVLFSFSTVLGEYFFCNIRKFFFKLFCIIKQNIPRQSTKIIIANPFVQGINSIVIQYPGRWINLFASTSILLAMEVECALLEFVKFSIAVPAFKIRFDGF